MSARAYALDYLTHTHTVASVTPRSIQLNPRATSGSKRAVPQTLE